MSIGRPMVERTLWRQLGPHDLLPVLKFFGSQGHSLSELTFFSPCFLSRTLSKVTCSLSQILLVFAVYRCLSDL